VRLVGRRKSAFQDCVGQRAGFNQPAGPRSPGLAGQVGMEAALVERQGHHVGGAYAGVTLEL
jgi:hypothetical protein